MNCPKCGEKMEVQTWTLDGWLLEEQDCKCPNCSYYDFYSYGYSECGFMNRTAEMLYYLRHALVIRVGGKSYMKENGKWIRVYPLAA